MMKLFTCVDHRGHWPVGVASIVLARDEGEARRLLEQVLLEDGLDTSDFTLREVAIDRPKAVLLANGEY